MINSTEASTWIEKIFNDYLSTCNLQALLWKEIRLGSKLCAENSKNYVSTARLSGQCVKTARNEEEKKIVAPPLFCQSLH